MVDRLEGWDPDQDVEAEWGNLNILSIRDIFERLGPGKTLYGESDRILGPLSVPIERGLYAYGQLLRTNQWVGNQKRILVQASQPDDEDAVWVDISVTPYQLKVFSKLLGRWGFLPGRYKLDGEFLPLGRGGPMAIYKAEQAVDIQGFGSATAEIRPISATPKVPDTAVPKVSFSATSGDLGATRVGSRDRVYAVEILDSAGQVIAPSQRMYALDQGPVPVYAEWRMRIDMSDIWRLRLSVTDEGVSSSNRDLFLLNMFGFSDLRVLVEV